MLKKIMKSLVNTCVSYKKIDVVHTNFQNDYKNSQVNIGQIQAELNKAKSIESLSEVEFRVFSQFGDDGIIQYLISNLPIPNKTFVEFGVENYRESNTRFLLTNNYWSGLIIDGSTENINSIKSEQFYNFFDLQVECAFIDRSNVNDLISKSSFDPNIGILSIDVDGNDYWLWDEIDVVKPIIVIVEYNALFGYEKEISIPYNKSFVRSSLNKGGLSYFGTSLNALCYLGEKKGYGFIGTNSAGNNAYFVKCDYMQYLSLPLITAKKGFNFSSFSESWDKQNIALRGASKIFAIDQCDVVDVKTGLPIVFSSYEVVDELAKEKKINVLNY